jgi:hypothetical protein
VQTATTAPAAAQHRYRGQGGRAARFGPHRHRHAHHRAVPTAQPTAPGATCPRHTHGRPAGHASRPVMWSARLDAGMHDPGRCATPGAIRTAGPARLWSRRPSRTSEAAPSAQTDRRSF